MTVCSVKGCHSTSGKQKKCDHITFHKFPVDSVIANRWIQIIRSNRKEDSWKQTKNTKICSLHFRDKDMYLTKKGLRRIRRGAVPAKRLFLSSSESDSDNKENYEKPHELRAETISTEKYPDSRPSTSTGQQLKVTTVFKPDNITANIADENNAGVLTENTFHNKLEPCTNCGKLMLPIVGLFCECCAVSACKRCHRAIDKKLRCKPVTWPGDKPFYHHWVHVGTSQTESVDQHEEGLRRYFCSWCQRTKLWAHTLASDNEHCDFQKYRNIIIPPACVQLEKGLVSNIKHPGDNDWEPYIILANPKSGSNRSDEVLSLFRGLLNPIQVVDISSTSPESVVRWLPPRCRILVAGGDGTVAWVMNSLFSFPHVKAAVAILPTGTGNDLSRVLGWGAGGHTNLDAHNIINAVKQASHQPLDRWKVTIIPKRSRLIRYRQPRVLHAYNYASIGVDAQVALDFHHARAQFLYRYASRTLNYMAYAFLGAGRALDGGCGGLERRLRVWPGGAGDALALPPLQALVALNIPSWGAGVDLWSMGNEEDVDEQSIHDGKLEVVGISSSFHIARLQCGLAEPYRFAQASSLKIELEGSCAMQVDGEPWMQGPATILIEPAGQSLMLRACGKQRRIE